MLETEVEALVLQNRTESALRKARRIYKEAQKAGHREGLGTSSYCIAYIYHLTQNEPEAEKYMREAIRLLDDHTLSVPFFQGCNYDFRRCNLVSLYPIYLCLR